MGVGGIERMRSKELEPGFWGGTEIDGGGAAAEERNLGLGIPIGNGGSREMGRLEDLGALVIVVWALSVEAGCGPR